MDSPAFLLPPIFSDLQEAASVGPMIAINKSSTFLDAIIISSGAQPMHMKLGILTPEKLAELERFLEALWDMIVHAIVRVLPGELQLPVGSRIWWCLTSSMPLHDAGPYRRGEANLNQIYVSSYAPTLAALVKSRRGMQQEQEPRSFSAISQADLPTAYLAGAVSEANLVKTLIPGPTSFVHLSGQEATRKRVLEALKRHDWVYSACHREQEIQ
ncbi:hypothetical protein F5141DRAFT_1209982 [Pisolithus sp. B1]|nr:hypothetical protein F5141DRAFT_1209982 [Pisolithus sp. B1]